MATCINCNTCPGKKFPQLASPIIAEHRAIMVIGEAFTAIECRSGKALTGKASEVLQQTMARVGLPVTRDKVHYTVALACAYPRQKGKQFPKEALHACRDRLIKEIQAVKPKIIITLGKAPLQTLIDNYNVKVTEEYGRVRQYDYCGDALVIPVMHPALLMRAPKDYKPFLASIQLIATLYSGGKIHSTGETRWQILRTEEDCNKAIEFLKKYKRVNADMETTGLDYRVVEFLVMGICFEKNKVLIVPREMRHRVKEFFAIKDLKWTWHHGKYDSKVMWRRKVADVPLHDDTIYMHYALDETSAHDLGTLTKTFLQAEEYKYKMNQNWKAVNLESYPQFFDALCERVAVDCDYGYQLEDKLLEELNKPDNAPVKKLYHEFLMPCARFLTRVERNGMLVDEDFLNDMNDKYDIELARILREVEESAAPYWNRELYMKEMDAKSAPEKFNPGSPKQMSWMIFHRLKLKPKRRKGTSTNADVLDSIEEDIPLINKVLEYRSVKKEQSTYVQGTLKLRDTDGRVRSTFSMHIAATGRSTSKEPNVQNVPSANGVGNVRRAYIPRKGYILMEIDYSGAELRWLAFLSRCPVLMDVFKHNRNLHNETATALYGPNFTKQQKMRAKAVNFGIPYGREAQSFKEEFDISMEEAHGMIDGWLNKYHGSRDYLQWCAQQVLEGKYLETPWGQRRRFGLVTTESLHGLQNEAKNFPIQSSSSHLLFYSAMQVEDKLRGEYKTDILDLIHDSMLLEVPDDIETIKAVSSYVSQVMVQAPIDLFNCDVPFKTDCDLGPSWGEVQPFNANTGNMEIEHKDGTVEIIPYKQWITAVYHNHIYETEWYKNLEQV